MPRNTVKTSAEALYIGLATDPTYRLNYYNMYAVPRVQSASYSYSLAYTDINEFGQEARIDSLVTEAPSVPFQFSYYATDGATEKAIGLAVNTGVNAFGATDSLSLVSTLLNGDKGQNYFIVQDEEGTDAFSDTARGTGDFVVGIGNAFLTRYSIEASVGSLAMANVSFEAFNIKTDRYATVTTTSNTGFEATANLLPSINPTDGQKSSGRYNLPYLGVAQNLSYTGVTPSALRPGDILIEMTPKAGGKSMTQLGASNVAADTAHIQSFSLEIPLNRTVLGRLGNTFGYSRELNTPIEINFNMSAILADLKTSSVYDALFANEKYDLSLTIHKPSSLGDRQGSKAMVFKMYNFTLQNENFSSAIGNNKTVDLSFKGQVAGRADANGGVFLSGSHGSWTGQSFEFPWIDSPIGFYQADTISGAPAPTLGTGVAGNITLFP
jgi:hypothetical protein